MGPGFPVPSDASPGPIYTPKLNKNTRATGFGKSSRNMGGQHANPTPGPKYELVGTLGNQLTRASSPACRIGQASRFSEKEYLSAAHSKCASVKSETFVGPATYQTSLDTRNPGPAYSFGGADGKGRFNDKVFISRAHSKSAGCGDSGPGPQPTLTKNTLYGCNHEASSRSRRAPAMKFCSNDFGGTQQAKPERAEESNSTPGPGVYDPAVTCTKEKAPAFSFGMQADSSKIYISSALTADSQGRESPGPTYNPEHWAVHRAAPAYSFAGADPDDGASRERFCHNRYIGGGIGAVAGMASPGPALYDSVDLPKGPACSMGRKEKRLLKRICPAPENPRFVSKELAKDNLGCYSPGPKYALAGTVGASGSVAHTFGLQDRQFDDLDDEQRSLLGTADKPYASPSEARYLSKEHSTILRGKYSPGPKYKPATKIDRTHVTASGAEVKRLGVSIESAHVTAPSVSMAGKPLPKTSFDDREYHPNERFVTPSAPGYGFGSASRYGGGPCSQNEASGKSGKGDSQDKRAFESSPGPGAFKPNHGAVESHVTSISFGGLASCYNNQQATKARRPKTTTPPPTKV